jgi:hypothetical protein
MRGCVRWGFARSTYSPLKVGKFGGTHNRSGRSARDGRAEGDRAAVDAAHAALRMGQEELDILLAAPATGWGEAGAKARYLLILFGQTPAAEDPRRATVRPPSDARERIAALRYPATAIDLT